MAKYLADTNVFIAAFKGDTSAANLIERHEAARDSVVYLELIQGAKNKSEIKKIERFLAGFDVLHFDRSVSERAIDLVKTYSKSHGLMLPDAVIAARCLEDNLTLITRNIKNFQFIESLKLLREK
jgi:predicted nucleic acid-binding protein